MDGWMDGWMDGGVTDHETLKDLFGQLAEREQVRHDMLWFGVRQVVFLDLLML